MLSVCVPGCSKGNSKKENKEEKTVRHYFGEDTEYKRDGTPHKYVVLSFDDGITQDKKLIDILNKYNITASFNINTGLFGESWDWVAEVQGNGKDFPHLRWTEEEIKTGIYDGMDICSHGFQHASCVNESAENIINDVKRDAEKIEEIFGKYPRGFAYPGGSCDSHAIEVITENTDIRYARTINSTRSFNLPKYFMEWNPTCDIVAEDASLFLKNFLKKELKDKDLLLYGWSHAYELDIYENWDKFEKFIKELGEARDRGDVIVLTDAEFYELFKDEIPSIREKE